MAGLEGKGIARKVVAGEGRGEQVEGQGSLLKPQELGERVLAVVLVEEGMKVVVSVWRRVLLVVVLLMDSW